MTNLQTLLTEAAKLNHEISRLLKVSTYSDYGDLSELDIDAHNGEQIFLRDELTYIMQKLSDAQREIEYLNLPIGKVSRLHRNGYGHSSRARWQGLLPRWSQAHSAGRSYHPDAGALKQ